MFLITRDSAINWTDLKQGDCRLMNTTLLDIHNQPLKVSIVYVIKSILDTITVSTGAKNISLTLDILGSIQGIEGDGDVGWMITKDIAITSILSSKGSFQLKDLDGAVGRLVSRDWISRVNGGKVCLLQLKELAKKAPRKVLIEALLDRDT